MLKRIVRRDLVRMLKSPELYISILIVLICAGLALKRNWIYQNLRLYSPVGALNLFIYSAIKNNTGMSIFAPFVAVLPFSYALFDEMQTGFSKNIIPYSSFEVYIKSKVISSLVSGGGAFAIAYTVWLISLCIISPETSIRMGIGVGQFKSVYDYSMLLFCLLYIVYVAICGAAYALLATGLSLFLRNKYIVIGCPVILYYASFYASSMFPSEVRTILSYILPFLTFEITSVAVPAIRNFSQIGCIYALALILIYAGQKKYWNNQ